MNLPDFNFNYFRGDPKNLDQSPGYIRRKLGHKAFPISDKEMDDQDIQDIIHETLEIYSASFPFERRIVIPVQQDVKAYQLSDYGNGIYRIEIEPQGISGSDLTVDGLPLPVEEILNLRIGHAPSEEEETDHYQTINYSDIYLTDAYLTLARRILGSEFSWYFQRETGKLYLDNIPETVTEVVAVCDNLHSVETIRQNHREWFKRYVVARAKEQVGQVRSTFTGIRSPGDIALSDQWLPEAKETLLSLRDELRNMRPELPPIRG